MRKLLYALTIAALLAVGVAAQQAGGAFIPGFGYTITGAWTFSSLPALTGYGSAVGTSGSQTLTGKTLTSPVLNTPTISNPSITSVTPVNVTGTSLAVTAATHCGRTITLNRAAGIAITLPEATGTGCVYTFVVGTTFTGDATITATATDYFSGTAILAADGGDTNVMFATANTTGTLATESDIIDLFDAGNVTGGIVGAVVVLIDTATDRWSVRYQSDAAGAEATPFKVT